MEGRERSIPIRSIVENCMEKYDCSFPPEFVLYLRRYVIAALNLCYFQPANIIDLVSRFCERIRVVEGKQLGNKYYEIKTHAFIIDEFKRLVDEKNFEAAIFGGIFEVLSGADEMPPENKVFTNTIISITGEKIYQMDVNNNRIVQPKTQKIKIDEQELEFRSGYQANPISVGLLKQLFVANEINENALIRKAHFTLLSTAFDELSSNVKKALIVIETIISLHQAGYEKEVVKAIYDFEISLAKHFHNKEPLGKMAFIALLTTANARAAVKNIFENESD